MQLIHCMEAAFYFSPKEMKCEGELRKEQSIPAESQQNFNIHFTNGSSIFEYRVRRRTVRPFRGFILFYEKR